MDIGKERGLSGISETSYSERFQVDAGPVEADGRGGSRESRAERSTVAEMMRSVASKKSDRPSGQ